MIRLSKETKMPFKSIGCSKRRAEGILPELTLSRYPAHTRQTQRHNHRHIDALAQAQAHTNGVQHTEVHHTRNAVAMLQALFPIPEIHGAIFRHTLSYPRKQVVAPLMHRYDVTRCFLFDAHIRARAQSLMRSNVINHAHMKMMYLCVRVNLPDKFLVRLIRVISIKVHSVAVTIP